MYSLKDPLNTSETVIVVRSVVPGGIAQLDGRLVPGDRIMYVNDTCLDTHTSLDCAVQALKGAPFGPVKIGISRPINFEEDNEVPGDLHKSIPRNDFEQKQDKTTHDQKEMSVDQNKLSSVSTGQNVLSTKSITTSASTSFCTSTERSPRESASDTFAEGSNLSDWKTDYGVNILALFDRIILMFINLLVSIPLNINNTLYS